MDGRTFLISSHESMENSHSQPWRLENMAIAPTPTSYYYNSLGSIYSLFCLYKSMIIWERGIWRWFKREYIVNAICKRAGFVVMSRPQVFHIPCLIIFPSCSWFNTRWTQHYSSQVTTNLYCAINIRFHNSLVLYCRGKVKYPISSYDPFVRQH